MIDQRLHELIEGRIDSIRAGREDLRASAEARVAQRRWSAATWMADPRPFYFERHQLPRSRFKDRPPDKPGAETEYGYDEQGRPVLVREFAYGKPSREEYVSYEAGYAESYEFAASLPWEVAGGAPEWHVLAVTRQTFDDRGRIVGWDRGGVQGWRWERYHYAGDGRLQSVEEFLAFVSEEQNLPAGLHIGDVGRWEEPFVYDDDGLLAAIRKSGPDWDDVVIWRRAPKSLKPAAAKVEATLVEALACWAREHWPDERIYCFAIGYSDAGPLAVAPALGTARERTDVLSQPDEYGVGLLLWNPAEFEIFDPDFEPALTDPEYSDAAALLVQEWDMTENDQAAPRLLANVAKRLAAMDWMDHPVTPDFVVIAIDMEIEDQAHLERHLEASVPKALLSALKAHGLLHVTE